MSTNATLVISKIRQLNLFFPKSHFIKSGFFILVMSLMACQSLPPLPHHKVSALDQSYRLQRELQVSSQSSAVNLYREGLARTLYSRCKWFPSDSRYAQIAQNRCGAFRGGMMAFSRFMC